MSNTTNNIVSVLDAEIMGAIDRGMQQELGYAEGEAYAAAKMHTDRIVQCVKDCHGIEDPARAIRLLHSIHVDKLLVCNCGGPCDGTCTAAELRAVLGV